ncbi:MAG: class I SAM-dependent methyltransferase [Sphingomonadaceae bacterium]|jgi:SAM-dependent methyltransferase|nr:class I SAM-dependent methyltransferase [Sphingomonadaceae bacterium]
MNKAHGSAWQDFWADNVDSCAGGCLPQQWHGIVTAQIGCWQRLAKHLPRKARILDIATGDGRVMDWVMRARRDIKPVGCDLAEILPKPPAGAKVRTGVAMENLPFHDASFAAVTSQFGFEYGDTLKAACEISRVLQPDGIIGLMTHRQDGAILAHNLRRREQIRWVLEELQLIETAKRHLSLRASGIVASLPQRISQAPAEGAARFGHGSAAWEIPEAIRQTLLLGQRDHPATVSAMLDTISEKARNELGRIASLEAACATTSNERGFLAAIGEAGLEQVAIETVCELVDKKPFADFRTLHRAR